MKLHPQLIEIAGWVPAVIFPLATAKQLHFSWLHPEEVVDPWPWFLFGIANICLYVYSEKHLRPQAIIGFLGTALLDFLIVGKELLG